MSGLGDDDSLTGDPYQVVRDLPTERGQVLGGDGDDEVYVRTGADVAHGDAGNDSLVAYSAQPAKLPGDDGDDVLTTQPVTGFALDGGAGSDTGAFGYATTRRPTRPARGWCTTATAAWSTAR